MSNLNAKTLKARLLSEAAKGFAVQHLGDDIFCLIREGDRWQVVYAERGAAQEVLFESPDEAAACEFLYHHVSRFRHDHVVGFFADSAEAERLSAELKTAGIPNDVDSIPWREGEWHSRVFVYGKDLFRVRRLYGKLPLERLPTLPERIHDALRRLGEFNLSPEYNFNPPVDEIEQQVWSVLEFTHSYRLPEVYSRFLLEVGDGGQLGSTLRYLSLREVFEANSAELYRQPIPRFVRKALSSPGDEIEIPPRDIGAGFPGLLRISSFSYNQRAWYLTEEGGFLSIEHLSDEVRVSAWPQSLEQFYREILDAILSRSFGLLGTYEHTLELMQFGCSLSDLEHSLGMAEREWKHGLIAQILKTTPDNLEAKLAAWQEQNAV